MHSRRTTCTLCSADDQVRDINQSRCFSIWRLLNVLFRPSYDDVLDTLRRQLLHLNSDFSSRDGKVGNEYAEEDEEKVEDLVEGEDNQDEVAIEAKVRKLGKGKLEVLVFCYHDMNTMDHSPYKIA